MSQTNPGDSLENNIAQAMRQTAELRADRDIAIQERDEWRRAAETATAKAEQMARLYEEAARQRDHYMRFGTELVTAMGNVEGILRDCFEKAKVGAYRNNGVAPTPEAHDVDKVTADIARRLAPALGVNPDDVDG